jgi:pyroglutamyl-peptidase
MKIIVTGFEPFADHAQNPSQMLVESLLDRTRENIDLVTTLLPVDRVKAPRILLAQFHQHQPDAVLCFGLAAGRAKISLERVALNLLDFSIPDNQGLVVSDSPISAEGPTAYFSTLPIQSILTSSKEAGVPAEISLSAGTYLCNLVFYTLMHEIARAGRIIPAGFIHLPALPQQTALSDKPLPSLSFDLMSLAAEIILTHISKPHE